MKYTESLNLCVFLYLLDRLPKKPIEIPTYMSAHSHFHKLNYSQNMYLSIWTNGWTDGRIDRQTGMNLFNRRVKINITRILKPFPSVMAWSTIFFKSPHSYRERACRLPWS